MFDSRFPDRKFLRDSDVKHSYEHQVVGEAYITSFMSIAQCMAELSVLYPNKSRSSRRRAVHGSKIAGASFFTKAVWEIRTQKLLGAFA